MRNNDITYRLAYFTLTIFNSWRIHKWQMRSVLRSIRAKAEPDQTFVFRRSLFSLKMEWICHNFLYRVGYQRWRTGDVDLDYPCDRPEWQYIVCGILVWIFVW